MTEAKAALEIIQGADLILLDVILPPGPDEKAQTRYAGRDLLREWRAASLELPPVIVLTAVRNPDVLDDLRKMGVSHVITKPTLPSDLQNKVHEVLEARRRGSS